MASGKPEGHQTGCQIPRFAMNRRSVLTSAAAALPILASSHAVAREVQHSSEFDRLEALIKMRGSTDGRVGFSWISGTRYARVGDELRPMCGMLNCTLSRYTKLSQDAYDLRLYEMSFYTDLESGRYEPSLEMPFTGKRVEVPLYRTGPGKHIVKTSNHEEMSWSRENTTSEEAAKQLAPDGSIFYSVELSQPTIVGNNVWLTTEATTRLIPDDPDEKPWSYKEFITNHGPLDDLADRRVKFVDSAASYTLVMGWRPWMQMEDIEGQTVDHAIGGRVWRLGDLPRDLLWHINAHHPDFASDPMKWLET